MNNVTEYEALVMGVISTLQIGIWKLQVHGDSKLFVQQINKDFALKESPLPLISRRPNACQTFLEYSARAHPLIAQ